MVKKQRTTVSCIMQIGVKALMVYMCRYIHTYRETPILYSTDFLSQNRSAAISSYKCKWNLVQMDSHATSNYVKFCREYTLCYAVTYMTSLYNLGSDMQSKLVARCVFLTSGSSSKSHRYHNP